MIRLYLIEEFVMKPLKSADIKGVWGSLLLPLNPDETIDWPALEGQIRYLTRSGVDGVYSNGTACEFFAQSEKEYERICELLSSLCEEAGTAFQIGASHMDWNVMAGRIKTAVKYRPGAVQIILPDWFPMSDAEISGFLERALELAGGIGIVLYNPPHAKRVLNPQDIKKLLLPAKGVVGLKTGAGDESWYAAMVGVFPELSVFCPGHYMAAAIKRGAAGSYSNVACLSPGGTAYWYGLMKTDMERALKLEEEIRRFMEACIAPLMASGYAGFVMDKLNATAGNWFPLDNRVRQPYRYPGKETVEKVRKGAWEIIPELIKFNELT
jgi:dihydrodipicolinate synthase/N-acetylneuraminate lyase